MYKEDSESNNQIFYETENIWAKPEEIELLLI